MLTIFDHLCINVHNFIGFDLGGSQVLEELDLESLRIVRGLSVSEVARRSSVSRTTTTRVLAGDIGRTRPEILARVRAALGADDAASASPEELTGRLLGKANALTNEIRSFAASMTGRPTAENKALGKQMLLLTNQLQDLTVQLVRLGNKMTQKT